MSTAMSSLDVVSTAIGDSGGVVVADELSLPSSRRCWQSVSLSLCLSVCLSLRRRSDHSLLSLSRGYLRLNRILELALGRLLKNFCGQTDGHNVRTNGQKDIETGFITSIWRSQPNNSSGCGIGCRQKMLHRIASIVIRFGFFCI